MNLLQPARLRPRDRVQTESDKSVQAGPVTFPPPTAGWVESVTQTEAPGNSAVVLENMFPTETGARVRGGSTKAAMIPTRVRSMFAYKSGTTEKLFACNDTAIYDVTALNPLAAPASAVSGLTSGYFSTSPIGTVGGQYLYAVNGTDSARLFDGTTWTAITGVSTPAITGAITSQFSFVWTHKSRLWFVRKNTNTAYYLPVDSIGGAVGTFSLAGVFQKGGSLFFGATWTQDAGDGPDDRIAFVSTEGEVAVYQGANPADATTWGLVGLYKIPPPRGINAHIKAGGDVIFATNYGMIPLSAITQKDAAALEGAAVTRQIQASWRREAVRINQSQPWEVIKWPSENMLVVSLPHQLNVCYVANLLTGAWTKYIGWDVHCLELFQNALYFGDRNGSIFSAETGGTDNGNTYAFRVGYTPCAMGDSTAFKSAGAISAKFSATVKPSVKLSLAANYAQDFPGGLDVTVTPLLAIGVWDVGLWDVMVWDDDGLLSSTPPVFSSGWISIASQGTVLSPQVQGVISGERRPNIELIEFSVVLEAGGSVV